jgi:hypothetical protein
MKLYSPVREILSAVLFVPNRPNVMDIMHRENAAIDVPRVPDHSFDHPTNL